MTEVVSQAIEKTNTQQASPHEDWQTQVAQQAYGPDVKQSSSLGSEKEKANLSAEMSTKPLTEADLQGQSEADISIARNTPYAEHGRQFKDQTLQNYFGQQSWYQANPDFKDSDLTPLEVRNVDFLNIYELDHNLNGARDPYAKEASNVDAAATGQTIADHQTKPLTDADVANLDDPALVVARNEIFAAHGYQFHNADLKNLFEQMPWYKANPDFKNSDLSWMENRNIEFIQMNELERKNKS